MPSPTPKELGFRMPAEWEKHSAIWLSWPHDPESFPYLEAAEESFVRFMCEISETEHVELQVVDEDMWHHAEAMLRDFGAEMNNVSFHIADYADIWFRDYGPIFVVNDTTKELAMTKWVFNAWGNKYDALLKDNEVPYAMNQKMKLRMFEPGIVLEGGSIDVNGAGTLMTSEQCLLNKNRNPKFRREDIEKYLSDYLGVSHFIWLKDGIEGDDTDGHIDDIARFVNASTVVAAYEENEKSPDHKPLKENWDILESAIDQDGEKLNLLKVPMPGKVRGHDRHLPASYTNFYIGNGKVLVPIFGAANDEKALEVIRSAFPDRKVVGIDARYIVYGFGTFHCMSQQQPFV